MANLQPLSLSELAEKVSGALPGAVTATKLVVGELTLTVAADRVVDVLTHLQADPIATLKFWSISAAMTGRRAPSVSTWFIIYCR